MKAQWQKVASRIDGLTLRERVIVFLMAALILVTVVNALILDPQNVEQKQISQRIKQEQVQIARIRAEIQQKVNEHTVDPDATNRARLVDLERQATGLQQSLGELQKGLVSPDKIATLLESMLKKNSRVRLVSLKNVATENLMKTEPATKGEANPAAAGLFRHGVELTVRGTYLDTLAYLEELENLEPKLFWGGVTFNVEEHPNASMTLTVYTLSLDKQWLNI